MSVNFTQTDTVAVCGAATYCSASTLGSNSLRQATVGGTPGVTIVNTNIAGFVNNIGLFFECIVPPGINWSSGTWTVRLNITTGAGIGTLWSGFDVCRVDSGCVSQTLIATINTSVSINSIGVKTLTAVGSAQTPNLGDKVMILLRFNVVTGGTLHYRPDQNIDSPFDFPPVMTFLGLP